MNIEHPTSNIQYPTRGRWVVRAALSILAAGMVLSVSSGAEETNAYPSLDSFQIIGRRNIFDPFRSPQFTSSTNGTPRARLDAFSLVGTMSYSKGRFAFFDGTGLDYKKVIEPGGIIAGYTVKEITQDAVTLGANGKEFQMKVGTQMRNQGNNKWLLAGHIIDDTAEGDTNGEANGDNTAAASTTAPTGGSPEMSDILKKMAERRQQELK